MLAPQFLLGLGSLYSCPCDRRSLLPYDLLSTLGIKQTSTLLALLRSDPTRKNWTFAKGYSFSSQTKLGMHQPVPYADKPEA